MRHHDLPTQRLPPDMAMGKIVKFNRSQKRSNLPKVMTREQSFFFGCEKYNFEGKYIIFGTGRRGEKGVGCASVVRRPCRDVHHVDRSEKGKLIKRSNWNGTNDFLSYN